MTKGEPLICSVDIDMNQVFFQAWRVNVGRAPVYLLDTNRSAKRTTFPRLDACGFTVATAPRASCRRFCSASAVCGCCGRLELKPSVFHMNEGHAAFLTLELAREKMAAGKKFRRGTGEDEGRVHFHDAHAC